MRITQHHLLMLSVALFFESSSLLAGTPPITVGLSSYWGAKPGDTVDLSIVMHSPQALGGIDFTVGYDTSVFQLDTVYQDVGLNHWEYFTHYDTLQAGTVRVIAIADFPFNPGHPDPQDFYPNGSIARLRFAVSPSWAPDSTEVPLSFYWRTCGDNAASNKVGDTLYVIHRVFDWQGQLLWDEDDSVHFPESNRIPHVGLPDSCLAGTQGLVFSIDFQSGVVSDYFICGNADGNGDVDISDIVYLIAYIFASGETPQPLSAADLDCSGVVDVSDAVYLVSYIFSGGPPPCAGC